MSATPEQDRCRHFALLNRASIPETAKAPRCARCLVVFELVSQLAKRLARVAIPAAQPVPSRSQEGLM